MTNTTTRPALYVGTYAKYNNGSIAGKWLYLDNYESKEAFLKACAKLHKDEVDPEFMFQDFEGFPKELYDESYLDPKLFEYLALDQEDRELVDEYIDATGYSFKDFEMDQVRDKLFCELDYTHSVDDENAMGDYVIENGLMEVPDHLLNYIDYQAIGRDWLMDFSVSSNGFVFES